jgi:hypothetical protein
VAGTGGVMGGSSNAGAYASSGFPGSDKTPVSVATSVKSEPVNSGIAPLTGPTWQQVADAKEAEAADKLAAKPDPTKTAYADLTPKQRADMTQDEKMAYIRAALVASKAAAAGKRAATDPMFNFAVRPEAPAKDANFIYYYSWIGGVSGGEWKLYRALNTPENVAKYGSRVFGGPTQATSFSAVGAGTLINQPSPVYGADGGLTGWNVQGVGTVGTGGTGTGGGGTGGGGTGGGGGAGGTGNSPVIGTGAPTTNIDVLKAALRGLGFTSAILDSSTTFLNNLLKDGLDYDNATEIFLNNKEYTLKSGTKMESPFYTEYGYLNEGLVTPKSANELFNFVEGAKGVIDKYKLSTKFIARDALKEYVKNGKTVTDLSKNAATAQLKALEADPFQVQALIAQGFIASAAGLNDFYMDPKIGQEQLELNRQSGVFTAEALRRAKTGGIVTDAAQLAKFRQLAAGLTGKGYNDAQIAQLAGVGFENVAQDLRPLTSLSQIYEKTGGTVASNAALTSDIQSSLLAEEFQGTASERRKRLAEQNLRAFQGTSGVTSGSLRTAGVSGLL